MKTRIEKIYVELTASKNIIDNYDGSYFHHQGLRLEDVVAEHEVENGVVAHFEGFEVMPGETKQMHEPSPMITAKLYYSVEIKID